MLRHNQEGWKLDTPKNTPSTLDDIENMFTNKLIEAGDDGSLFPYPEDELSGVEYLLAEAKCNNLVDDVLDAVDSNFTRGQANLEFLDGMLEGTEGVLQEINKVTCSCEDFLLGNKLAEQIQNLKRCPCGGSTFGNLGLDSPSSGFNGRISNAEHRYNWNSSLLDNMQILGLHEDFENMLGGEMSLRDKQWLKLHISFGLQNLVDLDEDLNLLKQGLILNENEANLSSGNEFCSCPSVSFTSMINDKTISGCQKVKKERSEVYDSLQTLSSDDNRVGVGFLDSQEKGVLITQRGLCKPTWRYIEEASGQKEQYHIRKYGYSYKRPKGRFLHLQSQHRNAGFGVSSLDCQEQFLKGTCIQVLFGLPVQEGCSARSTSAAECQGSKDCINSGSLVPNEICEVEPFPAESQDDMSEDDSVARITTHKGRSRRKHHMLWTLSEVMKLIEGVSQHGVGRWTEIKRLRFSSSNHPTSVDLKDKWRDLLRASCTRLHDKRG